MPAPPPRYALDTQSCGAMEPMFFVLNRCLTDWAADICDAPKEHSWCMSLGTFEACALRNLPALNRQGALLQTQADHLVQHNNRSWPHYLRGVSGDWIVEADSPNSLHTGGYAAVPDEWDRLQVLYGSNVDIKIFVCYGPSSLHERLTETRTLRGAVRRSQTWQVMVATTQSIGRRCTRRR